MSDLVCLGDVITLEYGRSLPAAQRRAGSVPVYGSNGITGWHDEALVQGPVIVVGRKGSIGEVQYEAGPAFPIDTTYYALPRPGISVDFRYLFYMLRVARLTELNSATGVPGLNREHAYRVATRLPPLDEQKRVVGLLDRAAEIIRRADAARAKTRAIIPALYLDTFGDPASNPKGWPVAEIGELVDRIDGGWSPTCGEGMPSHDQWGVLKLSAVKASGFDAKEAKPLPNQADARPELAVRDGDLLFTRKNTLDLVGTAAVVSGSPCRRMLPDTVFRLVPAKPTSFQPEYLCALINLTTFRPVIRQLASGSAASMPGISKGRLLKLKVPLPTAAAQAIFSEKVQRFEALARHLDAAAIKAEAMAAGLSAELFGQPPHRGNGHG